MEEQQQTEDWIRGPGNRPTQLVLQRERNRRGAARAREALARIHPIARYADLKDRA